LYCDKAYTAQIAAGIQPRTVIWSTKQMMPANGLPIVKNSSHGKIKAISNLISNSYVSFQKINN